MILSIIVPVYNVERFVERCLKSCESQELPKEDYEVIVVNDGSTDQSLSVINEFAKNYCNIKVYSKSNGGLSSARNYGMKEAQGDYIMFLDSDDWIAENCLCGIAKQLRKDLPDCLLIKAVEVHGEDIIDANNYPVEKPSSGPDLLRLGVSPCAPFSIWNASFLKRNNLTFYEGIFHEDSEFTPRAHYLAENVAYYTAVVYYYYCNPDSITQTVNPKRAHDLVNVVCNSLSLFSRNVKLEHTKIFNYLVSMYLNNALDYIILSNEEEIGKFNIEVYNHKEYTNHLLHSGVLKYIVEGVLLKIFPKHSVDIFKQMNFVKNILAK